jgi:histidinol-phosphate aminotransferase
MSEEEDYITGLNRYPDPHQRPLKQLICDLRNKQAKQPGTLNPDNLFCGVGSDEAIDAVMRVFCKPGRDKIVICSPTYGMYKVSAAINEVQVIDVPLETGTWQMNIPEVVPQAFNRNIDYKNIKRRSHDKTPPPYESRQSDREINLGILSPQLPFSSPSLLEWSPHPR